MSYTEPIGKFKKRYGLDFPDYLTDVDIDLKCWKNWRQEPYCFGKIRDPHELFLKAVRAQVNGVPILTDAEWTLSPWSLEHVKAFTYEDTTIVWGSAGSSKSWDWGLLSLVDWYAGPEVTITLLCSTSKDALLKRTFASVIHYHRLFKSKGLDFPGVEIPSKVAIMLTADEHESASTKTGIFGIAVKDGPVAVAVGKIRGMHSEQVVLGVDELSAMPDAVWDPTLRYNLRVGAKRCRVFGLTNIDSLNDLAGRNSEPIGGWGSVDIDTTSWRTKAGLVIRHDGFRSPAITEVDGEKKYPYLINQKTLDGMIAEEGGNDQAAAIFTMVRAWPPDTSAKPVIVTPSETVKWKMRRDLDEPAPTWLYRPTVVAGLDGSAGGDTCALQFVTVGLVASGKWILQFDPEEAVPIKGASGGTPVTDQILAYCLPRLEIMGVATSHFAIDDSGPMGLADAFARVLGNSLVRFSFGSKAGELPVSAFNRQLAKDRYADTATELGFLYREYGRADQIRGLGSKILKQLTTRETIHRGGKLALIDKKTFKKNTGQKSPDEQDAGGLCLGVVRYVIGLAPGSSEVSIGPMEAQVNPYQELDQSQVADLNNLKSDYGVNNS